MSDVAIIAGSPTQPSRSTAVLAHLAQQFERDGVSVDLIRVRDLDAGQLLRADIDGSSITQAVEKVQRARAVIIGTPVYKAAYTGVLKAFLDVLPQDGFAAKSVLPIATGGTLAHLLVIDYALKPVISALGAQHVLNGIYIQDTQLQYANGELKSIDAAIEERLLNAVRSLKDILQHGDNRRSISNGKAHITEATPARAG